MAVHPAAAQFDKLLKDLGGASGCASAGGLSDAKVGSALQEALKVGTENAVQQTGSVDGFLLNKAIKILMPKPLQTMEQPLRLVGYGPQIDEFIVGMNRAAEKAVPFAKDIFWSAIGEMSFDDARKILDGSDTAATDYFKGKTSKKLQTAFKPSVTDVMNQVGVNQQYNALVGKYKDVPFSKNIAFDVNQYVTEKSHRRHLLRRRPGRKENQNQSGGAGDRSVEGSVRQPEEIASARNSRWVISSFHNKRGKRTFRLPLLFNIVYCFNGMSRLAVESHASFRRKDLSLCRAPPGCRFSPL